MLFFQFLTAGMDPVGLLLNWVHLGNGKLKMLLFFRNDFYDISWESKNYNLIKYLNKDFNGIDYFKNLEKVTVYQQNYINNVYSRLTINSFLLIIQIFIRLH